MRRGQQFLCEVVGRFRVKQSTSFVRGCWFCARILVSCENISYVRDDIAPREWIYYLCTSNGICSYLLSQSPHSRSFLSNASSGCSMEVSSLLVPGRCVSTNTALQVNLKKPSFSPIPSPTVYEARASHIFAGYPRTHQSRRKFKRHHAILAPELGYPLGGRVFGGRC